MTAFSELVAPHGVEKFLGAVLGREPAVFSGRPDRFAHLLPWPALNEILRRHRLEFPRLRLARASERVPVEDYTTETALRRGGSYRRIRFGALAACIRDGATLVVDSVDELYGPIDELAADMERTVRERVQVNCYASFGAVHGFDTHWDDHDVLVVQVHGRKRWRVFGPTRPYPMRRDVAHPEPPRGAPERDFVLEAGEVLHVPRGWWHDATALDEPSLHLTFGVTPATGVDLLAWIADEARRLEIARQDLPRFGDPQACERRVRELREAVLRELASPDVLDRFFRMRDAQAPPRGFMSLPWSARGSLPEGEDTRVRLVAPRAVLREGADTVELSADGQRYTFAAPAGGVLRALMDGRARTLAELRAASGGLDADTVRALCAELVAHGLVAVA